MRGYITAREAASELGMNYHTFLARVRRGKIKAKRFGWVIMIPVNEVKRVRANADNQSLAGAAR